MRPVEPGEVPDAIREKYPEYERWAYISGVQCTECGVRMKNVPIPLDMETEDDDYRIPLKCPNGDTFPFSFEITDDP